MMLLQFDSPLKQTQNKEKKNKKYIFVSYLGNNKIWLCIKANEVKHIVPYQQDHQ
jgi:hypothetical protein